MLLLTDAVANTMPSASTIMPPALPIRLMTALALDRRGLGVTSGISATAGDRNVAMLSRMMSSSATNTTSAPGLAAAASRAQACRAGTT